MDQTKQKIITVFREKGSELSTRDIAACVYEEYVVDPKDIESKRKIAQLHRKLLHHINILIRDGILRVAKHGEKGHKYFVLNLDDGEEITELTPKYKKRIVISKPAMPIMPIEGYEQQGIVIKYEPATWIDRLNSIVIRCEKLEDLSDLKVMVEKSFSIVNDAICLDKFQEIINKFSKEEIISFLEKVDQECQDYGKKINFIIELNSVNQSSFLNILESIIKNNSKDLVFIYSIIEEDIQERFSLLSNIIFNYVKNKKTLNIKNQRIQSAPCFIGNAGPYNFSQKEWNEKKDASIIACGQSSLIVDVEKFYSLYGLDIEKFSQLMINISKTFLSANSMQRRKTEDYFKEIIRFDTPYEKEFLELSRNYIRFWNYGLNQPGINQELVLNMISEAKKKINEFSIAEETIYKSCGMPTRFKIALSCTFPGSEEKLSQARYKKFEISNLEELYNPKIKKEILGRETVSEMFDGGNDVTFHRTGDFSPEDIIREISVIMGSYKLGFFSYNFKELKGNMRLTSYLE